MRYGSDGQISGLAFFNGHHFFLTFDKTAELKRARWTSQAPSCVYMIALCGVLEPRNLSRTTSPFFSIVQHALDIVDWKAGQYSLERELCNGLCLLKVKSTRRHTNLIKSKIYIDDAQDNHSNHQPDVNGPGHLLLGRTGRHPQASRRRCDDKE